MEAEQHDGHSKLTGQRLCNDVDEGINKACTMLPVASTENP